MASSRDSEFELAEQNSRSQFNSQYSYNSESQLRPTSPTDIERQNTARRAYETADAEGSKRLHQAPYVNGDKAAPVQAKETHQGQAGDYVQAIVFGGLDGLITTFAVVIAAAGGNLSIAAISIIGVANLIGDAVGMGVGDYISSRAESDHESAERKRENWEMENMLEVEKGEMIEVYMEKGLDKKDAVRVVNLLLSSKPAFLDVMMIEELGILPKGSGVEEWKSGLATFGAFMSLGIIPILPFLFSGKYREKAAPGDAVFISSIVLFSIVLFILGAYKGKITGKSWWRTGLTMLANGAVTTVIAFLIGFAFSHIK